MHWTKMPWYIRAFFPLKARYLDTLYELQMYKNSFPYATIPAPKRKDKRSTRTWPWIELSMEQIEGMFLYGQSMEYETPHGVLHIVPDDHLGFIDDRRKSAS